MTDEQKLPTKDISIPEPSNSEVQLTKEELTQKIAHYWKAIDIEEGYQAYFENWKQLDYYRDLKLKLYK